MKRRTGVLIGAIFAVAVCVVAAVYIRHAFPTTVTEEDVGIVAAGIALIAAYLTYRAAAESRTAATESRRALQLHFRPGDVELHFNVTDPRLSHEQRKKGPDPTKPIPLYARLTFLPEYANEYEVIWVDDSGRGHRRIMPPAKNPYKLGPPDDVAPFCTVLLDGVVPGLRQDDRWSWPTSGPKKFEIRCRDSGAGGLWVATLSERPDGVFGGTYILPFNLDDE